MVNLFVFEQPADGSPAGGDQLGFGAQAGQDAQQGGGGDFRFPIKQNYYINFAVDNVIAQLDNSFIAMTYQPFTGFYVNPGLTFFTKMAASDLFEDYRIVGGFRIGWNFNNEYFLSVENRKKLWDKQLVLHRLALPYTLNTNAYSSATGQTWPKPTHRIWPASSCSKCSAPCGLCATIRIAALAATTYRHPISAS